jgi:hypothetical protein
MGNGDFHWPLVLAALKNASANSSRTVTIEPLCTSGVPSMHHSKTNKDSSKTTINFIVYIDLPPFCLLVQCLKLSFKHGIHQSTLPCSIN